MPGSTCRLAALPAACPLRRQLEQPPNGQPNQQSRRAQRRMLECACRDTSGER